MIQFIEDHRGDHRVEPICCVLPVAPATFDDHLAKRADPLRLSDSAKRDEELKPEIERVFEENLSFDAVEYVILEWVDWFNNRQLLEPIGNIPPAEAEASFYAAMKSSDMAA